MEKYIYPRNMFRQTGTFHSCWFWFLFILFNFFFFWIHESRNIVGYTPRLYFPLPRVLPRLSSISACRPAFLSSEMFLQ